MMRGGGIVRLALHVGAMLALAAAGCGKSEGTKAGGAGGAPVVGTGQTWRLSEGRVLGTLSTELRNRIQVSRSILPAGSPSPVVFASLAAEGAGKGGGEPLIAGKVGSEFRVLPLVVGGKVAFPSQDWVTVGTVGETTTLYGVLDSAGEAPSPVISVLCSKDAGQTWTLLAGIQKPHPSARFASFAAAVDGKVSLSLLMDQTQDGIKEGRYHFRTADGGKTWSGPEFEPDDYNEAEPTIAPLEGALNAPPEG